MTRQEAYKQSKEEVARWGPIINRNRDAPSLSFPLNAPGRQNVSTSELQTKFTPSADSSLEKDLSSLLKTYGLQEDQLKTSETNELEKRQWTEEEITKREEQLAKMKSLLFYQELKQKRISKIKSKSYRKLQKKLKEKSKLSLEEMKELDPEAYEAEQRKMEQKRIEERMNLSHSANSKWVKAQLRVQADQKNSNTELKESLKAHQAKAAALRQKQESFPKELDDDGEEISDDTEDEDEQFDDDDDDDEEDSDSDAADLKHQKQTESRAAAIRAKLKELERDLGTEDDFEPADGFAHAPGTKKSAVNGKKDDSKGERLLGLKFMQRAAERSREETRAMIKQYELELEQELKREELRREARKAGKTIDDEELDAIIFQSGTSMDGADGGMKDITVGRKKMDPTRLAHTPVVTGVGADKIALLPNSLQAPSALSKGSKTRASGPISVAKPKNMHEPLTVDSSPTSSLHSTSNNHPGSHHLIHGKSSLPVDTPFVSKEQVEKLFPTEQFSDEEDETGAKPTVASVNTQLVDLAKIRHTSRAAQQAAKKKQASEKNQVTGQVKSNDSIEDASEDEDLDALADKDDADESNPWAAASAANPRKALRDEETSARTKKKRKVSKDKSAVTATVDEEGGDDDEDGDMDGNLDSVLTGPLALRSKRSEFDLLANGPGSVTQADLVRQAFSIADEDTLDGEEDEFERMKREAMEEDLPKEEKTVIGLPGWGSWVGAGAKNFKSKAQLAKEASEKHAREQRRLAAIAARRDAKLKHVLINEKVDHKALKYQVATLPYPFTSQEAYEKSLLTPIGKEWNTTRSFQAHVLPKVITRAGEIIDPIAYNPKVGAGGKKKSTKATDANGKTTTVEKQPTKISGGGAKRKR